MNERAAHHRPARSRRTPRAGAAAAAALCLLVPFANARAQCVPEWSAPSPPQHGEALALEVHDDGFGPALFVGGHLISAGGQPVNKIARWDGRRWSALGEGVGPSSAIAYAIAGISGMSSNANLSGVHVGGDFLSAGGLSANNIARWHERRWRETGGGTSSFILSLMGDPNGVLSGGWPGLHLGGPFLSAGGTPASGVAHWDGQVWSSMDGGLRPAVQGQQAYASGFAVFDDGSGPALYVGGRFSQVAGLVVNNIARWDGERWSALGVGIGGTVGALGVYDDGSGESLYAGHQGSPGLRRWDGQQWDLAIPGWDSGSPRAMVVHDDGSGPELYVAGVMRVNGGVLAHVASWDGVRWRPLPELSGLGSGTNARTLAVFQDDPTGRIPPALYVGGFFWYAGGIEAIGLARWGCPHPTLGCYGDCDQNGSLDFFDFLCFQNEFLAGDPYADCDRDGTLTFFDFLCFQNEFLAGCP